MIRLLPPEARASLRSGIAIPNTAQCVEELVLNSLDAEATCIAVRVDIPNGKIQVVDNGKGLTRDNFSLVGQHYATSKCHSIADLDNLKHFGYRGEALASISHIARVLEIVSRAKDSDATWTKMFRDGEAEVFEAWVKRPSVGTTVTAHGLFYNMPVRRKMISPSLDYERVCRRIEGLALIHPGVSFSLRDDSMGMKSIQTRITSSVINTFRFLFGQTKARSLKEVNHQQGKFNISGFISVEGHPNKNLQFVYLNSRLVLKSRLQKVVNYILRKSLIAHARPTYGEKEYTTDSVDVDFSSSPGKASDHCGIFVLNIKCPLSEYDICLEPSKSLVEFREWNEVLRVMEQLVKQFLVRENLTDTMYKESQLKSPDAKSGIFVLDDGSSQEDEDATVEQEATVESAGKALAEKYGRGINALSCSSTLQSLTVRRSQSRLLGKPITTPPKVTMASEKPVLQKTNSALCISNARQLVDGTANEIPDACDKPMDSEYPNQNKLFPAGEGEAYACMQQPADRCGKRDDEHSNVQQKMLQSPNGIYSPNPTKYQEPDLQSAADSSMLPSKLTEQGQLSKQVDTAETPHKEFTILSSLKCAENPNGQQTPCHLQEESKKVEEALVERQFLLLHPVEHETTCSCRMEDSDLLHRNTDVQDDAVSAHITNCRTNDLPEFRPDKKSTTAQDVDSPCVIQQKQTDASPAISESALRENHLKISPEVKSRSSSSGQIIKNIQECQKQFVTPQLTSTDILRKMNGNTVSPAINLRTSDFHADKTLQKTSSLSAVSAKNEHHLSHSEATVTPCASKIKPLIVSDETQHENLVVKAKHIFISLKPQNSQSSEPSGTQRYPSGLLSSLQMFKNSLQSRSAQIKSTMHSSSKLDTVKQKESIGTCRFFSSNKDLKHQPLGFITSPAIRLKKRTLGGLKMVAHNAADEKVAQVEVSPHRPVSPVKGNNIVSDKKMLENSKLENMHGTAKEKPWIEAGPTCGRVKASKNVDPFKKARVISTGRECNLLDRSMTYRETHDMDNYSGHPKPNLKRLASKSFSTHPQEAHFVISQRRNENNVETNNMEATLPKRFMSGSFLQSVQEDISGNSRSQAPSNVKMLQPVDCLPKDAVSLCTAKRSSEQQDKHVNPNVLCLETTKSFWIERHNFPLLNKAVHESHTLGSQKKNFVRKKEDPLNVFGVAGEPEASGSNLEEKTAVHFVATAPCQQINSDKFSSENELMSFHSKFPEILSDTSLPQFTDPCSTPSQKIREVRLESLMNNDSHFEVIHDELSVNDISASSILPETVSLGETVNSETDGLPVVDIGKMPSESSKLKSNVCGHDGHNGCGHDGSVAQRSSLSEIVVRGPVETNTEQLDIQQRVCSHGPSFSDQLRACDTTASPLLNSEKSEQETTDTCMVNKEKPVPSELNDDNNEGERGDSSKNVITDICGKCWSCHYDAKLNHQVYIDLNTGNCRLETPAVNSNEWPDDRAVSGEVTCARSGPSAVIVPTGRKKSHLHRVHSLCAQSFLSTSTRPSCDHPAEEAKGLTDLSPFSHSALIDMVEEHIDQQDDQIASKWRGESPSKLVTDDKSWMDELFDNWTNPMFASLESDITDAQCTRMQRNAIRAQNTVHPYKFTKGLFQDIKVLGQVDNKFIACMVRTDELNHATDPNLLLLIDQHAAHERIRLEQLISDVFEDSTSRSDDGDSSTVQSSVKSSNVIPSVELTMSHRELRLLRSFTDKLEVLGISYHILDRDRSEIEDCRVEITRLPACLIEREAGELRRGRPTVAISMVKTLLTEHLETLQKTSGANAVLPGTMIKVLNSQACHGAIKFGDQLNHHECLSLIGQLAQCDLPFQCAHGRPSLMPLLDLNILSRKSDKGDECKPRLQHLHHSAR